MPDAFFSAHAGGGAARSGARSGAWAGAAAHGGGGDVALSVLASLGMHCHLELIRGAGARVIVGEKAAKAEAAARESGTRYALASAAESLLAHTHAAGASSSPGL
eukprot:CAMPEP_0185165500 /NCGR_PEP_ID=MMETSP1139-20130426/10992_1 /TAXON_ID=298111 /ORGANISM="Pavlova sp., Strain CCMP459" /LENGTH=104 /DNA_ID=CAMNT_0027730905 /DNA_START=26 /DNA_END=337 /DNA_ORIENTATION=-